MSLNVMGLLLEAFSASNISSHHLQISLDRVFFQFFRLLNQNSSFFRNQIKNNQKNAYDFINTVLPTSIELSLQKSVDPQAQGQLDLDAGDSHSN